MNLQKTKIMSSNNINIDNHTVQLVKDYTYIFGTQYQARQRQPDSRDKEKNSHRSRYQLILNGKYTMPAYYQLNYDKEKSITTTGLSTYAGGCDDAKNQSE